MKLTIVADDNAVGIDGEFFSPLDLTGLDPNIHAVQWYGEYGEVEYKTRLVDGRPVKPENTFIVDVSGFQFAIAAWNTAKAEMEAANVAAEQAAQEGATE
jgi:hypothetical protein